MLRVKQGILHVLETCNCYVSADLQSCAWPWSLSQQWEVSTVFLWQMLMCLHIAHSSSGARVLPQHAAPLFGGSCSTLPPLCCPGKGAGGGTVGRTLEECSRDRETAFPACSCLSWSKPVSPEELLPLELKRPEPQLGRCRHPARAGQALVAQGKG